MTKDFIPVYKPTLAGKEKQYVNDCLDTTWISSKGTYVDRFEKDFSNYLGINYATSVSNGTVDLQLALLALGVGKDDEVIVPTLTYIASINAILMVGAKPVLVDSLDDTWNIDSSQISAKITSKTKAVMIVHLYGAPCDMIPIMNICRAHKLLLIEDAAEAFGSKYHDKYVGSFGDISTFSFFGNKTITTGEGGMVASNKKELIDYSAYLKSQAVSPVREYWHEELGYNFRMTNICAAIGVAQLENASEIVRKKQLLALWYKEELINTPLLFQHDIEKSVNSYWMISILVSDEIVRNGLRNFLKENLIETRPIFYPAHKMPVFKSEEEFPVAEAISKRGLNLPSFPDLTRDQVVYICDLIKRYLNN